MIFQSVTQAVWKKKMQITIGVEAMNFCLCHWLKNHVSYNYIHQAQNSPSHLYHLRCGFTTLQCRKEILCILIILLTSLFYGYVHVPSYIFCTTGATCNNIIPSLSQSLTGLKRYQGACACARQNWYFHMSQLLLFCPKTIHNFLVYPKSFRVRNILKSCFLETLNVIKLESWFLHQIH